MNDAEYRRRAHALLVACGNNGEMGHCIGCARFTASPEGGVAHARDCPVAALLEAGPRQASTEMESGAAVVLGCCDAGHGPECPGKRMLS